MIFMHLDGDFMGKVKINKHFLIAVFLIIVFSVGFVHSKNSTEVEFKKLPVNTFKKSDIENNIKEASKNEIIIIGDSRFKHIIRERKKYNIPTNFNFIAKSSTDVKWFIETAEPKLRTILGNKETNKKYYVVTNMGVNDIQYYRPFDDSINAYIEEYAKLINDYPNVEFYMLSINPIVEKKLIITQPENVRTNEDIEYFNKKLINFSKNNRIKYCNSYDGLTFNTDDGIHYTEETNQEILDYIFYSCVNLQ